MNLLIMVPGIIFMAIFAWYLYEDGVEKRYAASFYVIVGCGPQKVKTICPIVLKMELHPDIV